MTKTRKAAVSEPTDALAVVREKTDGMQIKLDSIQVTNEEELASASDMIKSVKQLKKFIEQEKEKYVAPAKEIISKAREQYDPLIKRCENAEWVLKERSKKFLLKQEAERKAKEEKIAKQVEAGRMKPETAAAKMEALPDIPKTVRTDTGSGLRLAKRKVARITDPSLVPDEFWIIDEVRVRREALERERYGKDQIPGVVVEEERDIASV